MITLVKGTLFCFIEMMTDEKGEDRLDTQICTLKLAIQYGELRGFEYVDNE